MKILYDLDSRLRGNDDAGQGNDPKEQDNGAFSCHSRENGNLGNALRGNDIEGQDNDTFFVIPVKTGI